MAVIEMKAQAVADTMSATPTPGGSLFQQVLAWLLSLLGSGGLGVCAPTTPAAVRSIIANPSRRHQRIAYRSALEAFGDPTLAANAVESSMEVGRASTEAECWTMYQEANGITTT